MVELIALLNGAWATAKKLQELAEKTRDAGMRMTVADLMVGMSDLKVRVAELQTENASLQSQLASKTENDELRRSLVHRDRVYYLDKPFPGRSPGPYCPRCLDGDGKYMVMREATEAARQFGNFECPACDEYF